MDASAATLASSGRNVGVAPLGTSLTDEQAGQLAFYGKNPIVATDADLAGRVAAERDLWSLPHTASTPGMRGCPRAVTRPTCWPGTVQPHSPLQWTRRGRSATAWSSRCCRWFSVGPRGQLVLDRQRTDTKMTIAAERLVNIAAITYLSSVLA